MSGLAAVTSINVSYPKDYVGVIPQKKPILDVLGSDILSTFSRGQKEVLQGIIRTPLFDVIDRLLNILSDAHVQSNDISDEDFFDWYLDHRSQILLGNDMVAALQEYYYLFSKLKHMLRTLHKQGDGIFVGIEGWRSKKTITEQSAYIEKVIDKVETSLKGIQGFLTYYIKFLEQKVLDNSRIEEYLMDINSTEEEELIDSVSPYVRLGKKRKYSYKVFDGDYIKNTEIPQGLIDMSVVDSWISYLLDDDSLKSILGYDIYNSSKNRLKFLKKRFVNVTGRHYVMNPTLMTDIQTSESERLRSFVMEINRGINNKGSYEQRQVMLGKYMEKGIDPLDTIFISLRESFAVFLISFLSKRMGSSQNIYKSSIVDDFLGKDFFVGGKGFDLKITNDTSLSKHSFKYVNKSDSHVFLMPKYSFYRLMDAFFEKFLHNPGKSSSTIVEMVVDSHKDWVTLITREIQQKIMGEDGKK